MNILTFVMSVLARHREERKWSDAAVATDLVDKLGLDGEAHADHPSAADPNEVTDDQVTAAEQAAMNAVAEAEKVRATRDAQTQARTHALAEREAAKVTAAGVGPSMQTEGPGHPLTPLPPLTDYAAAQAANDLGPVDRHEDAADQASAAATSQLAALAPEHVDAAE